MAAWAVSDFKVTEWYHFTAVLSSVIIIGIIFLELTPFRKWIFGAAVMLEAISLFTWWRKDKTSKPTGEIKT